MKKRLLALLLSVLLLASATACNPAPEVTTAGTGEDITTVLHTQNNAESRAAICCGVTPRKMRISSSL